MVFLLRIVKNLYYRRIKLKLKLKKLLLCTVLVGNAIASENYFETSFDCKSTKENSVEQSICINEKLAELDITIANLYQQALKIDSTSIKQSQRIWLKDTRNKCTTVSCLEKVHLDRENFLGNILMTKEYFTYKEKSFYKEENKKEFISEFELVVKHYADYVKKYNSVSNQADLNWLSSYKLKQCDSIWSTLAGTINRGYSGMCIAEKEKKEVKIFACYNMAGVLDIKEIKGDNNFELIKFLEKRCWGG